MPWVITKLCRDCVDMSCVEVCPVDCIPLNPEVVESREELLAKYQQLQARD